MNLPDTIIHKLIDQLTQSAFSFALYRLPWTDEPILVLQEEGETEILKNPSDLNEKQGFIFTPFHQTSSHPAVIIHPDKVAHEWDNISRVLEDFASSRHIQPAETTVAGQELTSDEEAKSSYEQAFGRFIAPLQKKTFRKLVLSRKYTQALKTDFSPLSAFIRACNSYPRMMISLCHTPLTGTWIGSTPEIILSGHETEWHTVALAGTMPMQGETMPTEWSEKNQEEQAFVSEYIRQTIKRFGSKLKEKGPYTARAGQLVHLKTDFHFQLKDTSHLGNILKELHPTPAVCGLPKEETYTFILENEGYDRSYYTGIIGWLDPQGDTTLYVNLRCMHIVGQTATLYAGGGILPSSTVETEWEETQQKMNTMRNIL